MQPTENLINVTWELIIIVGAATVAIIALLMLVRSILHGDGICAALKKAIGVILRNFP